MKGDESNLKRMKQKLTIFLLVFVIMAAVSGCTRKPQFPSIDTYELHCRNLNDNELIAEFYRVDVELQGALDDLETYQRGLAETRGFAGALGYNLGASIGGHPKRIVEELRKQKAVVLIMIYERGLKLPVSVE